MDRSFLSSPDVIKASRHFVCIRLATYEDKEEADFLRQVFTGRSGDLENTVFCLLAPDGRQRLTRSGRSPRFVFDSPADMAETMDQLAEQYPGKSGAHTAAPLPRMKNLRLALNVAACDGLPLVVAFADDERQLADLAGKLARVAVNESVAGRFAFYETADRAELDLVADQQPEAGIYVIQPGEFGLQGMLAKRLSPQLAAVELTAQLATLAHQYNKVDKQHRSHVRAGHRNDVSWETEIPVTDPMALRAQQRRDGR